MSQRASGQSAKQTPQRRDREAQPVGGRLTEALDAILQEAFAHGMRPHDVPPILFEKPAQQQKYEEIRNRALASWYGLKERAQRKPEGNGRVSGIEATARRIGQI